MENDIELINKQSSFDDFKIMKRMDLYDDTIQDGQIARKDNILYAIKTYSIPIPSAYDPNPPNFIEDAIQASKMSGFSKIYGAKMEKNNNRVSLVLSYPLLYGVRMTFRDVALSQLENKYDILKKIVSYLNSSIKSWSIYPKRMRWVDLYAGESKDSPVVIEKTQLTKSKNAYMQLYVLNLMALGFFEFDDRHFLSYYVDAVCDKNGNPAIAPENASIECKSYIQKMNVAKIFEFFKEIEQFINFDKLDIMKLSGGIMEFKDFNEDEIKKVAENYGYKVDDEDMSIMSIIKTAFILRDARKKKIISNEDKLKIYYAIYFGDAFGAALHSQCSNIDLTIGGGSTNNKVVREQSCGIYDSTLQSNNGQSSIAHKRKRFNNPSVDDF